MSFIREKRKKQPDTEAAMSAFIGQYKDIPISLETMEIWVKAFATELAIRDDPLINEDEFYGILLAGQLIKKLTGKESEG